MAVGVVRKYFQGNYNGRNNQRLLDKLINQAITVAGLDAYYIARNYTNYDRIYGEDDQSVFQNSWLFAVYIENVLGFSGDRDLLTKFAGLEIRDQIIVSVPVTAFEQIISSNANFPVLPITMTQAPALRPREGDLLWMPFNQKCFQIKYVNLTDVFFPLGKIYTWKCTCELFEYSSETFNTGIPEIDRIQNSGDLNIFDYTIRLANGAPIMFESNNYWTGDAYNLDRIDPNADNTDVETESNEYLDFSENNPFTETFSNGHIT